MNISERSGGESGREYAYRIIKDNIINLTLEPGSMVSESELATTLGLSRGPVREALIELASTKIIEVLPQRGIVIAPVDYDLIEQAAFMRETPECAVAERCCERGISPEILPLLRENVSLQRFYHDNPNREKLWELDGEFHRLLFQNAGLDHIHTLMNRMMVHLDRVRSMALSVEVKRATVEEHTQILDLILSGNAPAATALLHGHLAAFRTDRDAIREKYQRFLK